MASVEWVWLMRAILEVGVINEHLKLYLQVVCINLSNRNISFAGLKVDFAELTDIMISNALSYRGDHVQVYSNSWGAKETGSEVSGPDFLVQQTFENAVKTVRDLLCHCK